MAPTTASIFPTQVKSTKPPHSKPAPPPSFPYAFDQATCNVSVCTGRTPASSVREIVILPFDNGASLPGGISGSETEVPKKHHARDFSLPPLPLPFPSFLMMACVVMTRLMFSTHFQSPSRGKNPSSCAISRPLLAVSTDLSLPVRFLGPRLWSAQNRERRKKKKRNKKGPPAKTTLGPAPPLHDAPIYLPSAKHVRKVFASRSDDKTVHYRNCSLFPFSSPLPQYRTDFHGLGPRCGEVSLGKGVLKGNKKENKDPTPRVAAGNHPYQGEP